MIRDGHRRAAHPLRRPRTPAQRDAVFGQHLAEKTAPDGRRKNSRIAAQVAAGIVFQRVEQRAVVIAGHVVVHHVNGAVGRQTLAQDARRRTDREQ